MADNKGSEMDTSGHQTEETTVMVKVEVPDESDDSSQLAGEEEDPVATHPVKIEVKEEVTDPVKVEVTPDVKPDHDELSPEDQCHVDIMEGLLSSPDRSLTIQEVLAHCYSKWKKGASFSGEDANAPWKNAIRTVLTTTPCFAVVKLSRKWTFSTDLCFRCRQSVPAAPPQKPTRSTEIIKPACKVTTVPRGVLHLLIMKILTRQALSLQDLLVKLRVSLNGINDTQEWRESVRNELTNNSCFHVSTPKTKTIKWSMGKDLCSQCKSVSAQQAAIKVTKITPGTSLLLPAKKSLVPGVNDEQHSLITTILMNKSKIGLQDLLTRLRASQKGVVRDTLEWRNSIRHELITSNCFQVKCFLWSLGDDLCQECRSMGAQPASPIVNSPTFKLRDERELEAKYHKCLREALRTEKELSLVELTKWMRPLNLFVSDELFSNELLVKFLSKIKCFQQVKATGGSSRRWTFSGKGCDLCKFFSKKNTKDKCKVKDEDGSEDETQGTQDDDDSEDEKESEEEKYHSYLRRALKAGDHYGMTSSAIASWLKTQIPHLKDSARTPGWSPAVFKSTVKKYLDGIGCFYGLGSNRWMISDEACDKCRIKFRQIAKPTGDTNSFYHEFICNAMLKSPTGRVTVDDLCSDLNTMGSGYMGPDAMHHLLSTSSTCFRVDKLGGPRRAGATSKTNKNWTFMDRGLCASCDRKRTVVTKARQGQPVSAVEVNSSDNSEAVMVDVKEEVMTNHDRMDS